MKFRLLLIFTLFFNIVVASDLIEVLPLTNKVLLLHFKDGYTQYHQKGQKWEDDQIIQVPLNLPSATLLASYSLRSTDDAKYNPGISPTGLSQKSKGQSFGWVCTDWSNATGCQNLSKADHAKDHWIYLTLPQALQKGKTYTLNTGNLALNGSDFTFQYDETKLRSEAIHVNMIGYQPASTAKYAYLYHWMGTKGGLDLKEFERSNFYLWDTDKKQKVFSGTITFRRNAQNQETGQLADTPKGNFLGSDVYECDFSNFQTPGNYLLVVDGIGSSFPFKIAKDVFFEPFYWVMKGLYQQRSGIATLEPFTDQPRPAPHNPTLTPGFAGRLKYTSVRMQDLINLDHDAADKTKIQAGIKGPIDTWGWYQDAGDWDGYFEHTQAPIELLFLYENAPASFTDQQLDIPESGNGIPDLVDEARWLIRYFHRTRQAMKAQGYGTGGVGGARVAGDWFGDNFNNGIADGSWADKHRDWVVLGEDVYTTFRYAGMAAHLAYVLRSNNFPDPDGINWEQEAIETYQWALQKTTPSDFNSKFEVLNVWQNRLYAAAALYRLTGKIEYHDQFVKDIREAKNNQGQPVYSDGATLEDAWRYPMYLYLLMPAKRSLNSQTLLLLQNANSNSAGNILGTADRRACRWGGNFFFPMLIGQATTPMISGGTLGYGVARRYKNSLAQSWLPSIQTTADYFLGTNPLNMCWITGVGERSPEGIFNMDSWYLGKPTPRKGIVPYGPWRKESSWTQIGPWLPTIGHRTVTPSIEQWPGHEQWWNNRVTPLNAEYTVHQNLVNSIVTYGLLAADLTVLPDWDKTATSIREVNQLAAPKVIPNPGNGHFQILLPDNLTWNAVELTIMDINGRVRYHMPTQHLLTSNLDLEFKAEAGLYLAYIRTQNQVLVAKMIIQNNKY